MRILLWHGYLLGGTGSNVYTRQLAREWSRAGHDVVVFSPGAAPRAVRPRRRASVVRPDVGGLLPVFVLDRYDGYEVVLLQDCTRAAARRVGRGERRRAAGACSPPTSSSRTTSCSAGRSAAASGSPVRGQGPRLGARVLDARATGARGVGERGARGRGRDVRRLGAHPRRPRGGVRPRRPRVRGATRRRRRRVGPLDRATRRSPRWSRRRAATRRTPATPTSACPTRATPSGSAAFLAGDEPIVVYFGKLIEQKGVHVLLDAMRGLDARLVVVGFGPQRAALEAVGAARARSSPARSSTGT